MKDFWAEFWALLNTPWSELIQAILSLGGAAGAAFFYKIRRQQAEQFYRAQYPAPQYPVPHSEEEKERWVRNTERQLKLFYGICFWGFIGLAGMWLYFYIRPLKGSN